MAEAGIPWAWQVDKDILLHDITVVNVFQYLLRLDETNSGYLFLDKAGADVRPDCSLVVKTTDTKIKVAIEVELTQKSYTRIEDKFNKYLTPQTRFSDLEYPLVIYFFAQTPTFEAYKRHIDFLDARLDPLHERRYKEHIALVIAPNIKHRKFELQDAPTYFQGRIIAFKELIACFASVQ